MRLREDGSLNILVILSVEDFKRNSDRDGERARELAEEFFGDFKFTNSHTRIVAPTDKEDWKMADMVWDKLIKDDKFDFIVSRSPSMEGVAKLLQQRLKSEHRPVELVHRPVVRL